MPIISYSPNSLNKGDCVFPYHSATALVAGCGANVNAYGDHTLACPRTGLLARRTKILEPAWVVAREAVGPEGHAPARVARSFEGFQACKRLEYGL